MLQEVEDTLHGEEPVWVLFLTDSLHEDGEVVMVVELSDFNLPCNPVGVAVLDLDGQVTTVVEAAELAGRDLSFLDSASSWSQRLRSFDGLV